MIIAYQWLLQYLPEPLSIDKLEQILTAVGLEVEAVEPIESIRGGLAGMVIGKVLHCEKHPGADRLQVATVDTGDTQPLQIVCGAPNIAVGQHVLVATVGATLYPVSGEPITIKKAKIRGVESAGMICSEKEAGLGTQADGIMVLPENARPGTAAKDYFGIPEADYAIHIGLTPNRPDAMSHIGVARDVCAWLSHHQKKDYPVKLPDTTLPEQQSDLPVSVTVAATAACLRYAGITLSGVTVSASPEWLQQRLSAIGLRPVNNIVDITNFVLHAYGQPLHAFDADTIADRGIHVRFLPQDTAFTTLDSKKIALQAQDLMITDAAGKGLCIAGVYGGENSGVKAETTNIFLESAWFDPVHIRRTSMYHGLRTDAATHFEKGVDIENVVPALEQAASMICKIAGGAIASPLTDIYPEPLQPAVVTTTCTYIRQICGRDYPETDIRNILKHLDFTVHPDTGDTLHITVPTAKPDVRQPADIAEEIIRIDGLDQIAVPERLNITLSPTLPDDRKQKEQLASLLCHNGFQEIITNSITNSAYYPDRNDLLRLLNSLSSELDIMRPSMLESGLEVIEYNCNRKSNNLALFEFGTVYHQEAGKYKETAQLALFLTGHTRQAQWNIKEEAADIFFLKGTIQALLQQSGIAHVVTCTTANTITWQYKNQELCTAAVIPAGSVKQFDIRQEVYYAVINWPLWREAMDNREPLRYREISRFPAVKRDLALVLDSHISYSQVEAATRQLKLEALQEFGLFDVFESEKLGDGKKSLALNYTFMLHDRTLTDAETEQMMQQLMQTYSKTLDAQIRE